jgi:hypothetical protein
MTTIIDLAHLAPVKKKANGRPRKGEDLVPLDTYELQVFWSAIVRGHIQDNGEPAALKDRLRASELLAKSHQMFENANDTDEMSNLSDAEIEDKIKNLTDVLK